MPLRITVYSVKKFEDAARISGYGIFGGIPLPELDDDIQCRVMRVAGLQLSDVAVLRDAVLRAGAWVSDSTSETGRHNLLLTGTLPQLQVLGSSQILRSPGFAPLRDSISRLVEVESRSTARWEMGPVVLDLAERPCLMGILNLTPDSFSDGNRYVDVAEAVDRAVAMAEEGADIIDIGGESTRPDAAPVTAVEELRRVMPVVERLVDTLSIPLSIDTYKATVAERALQAGALIVNDISAMTFDERMPEVVSRAGAGIVLMHTRGTPAEMQKNTDYHDIVADVATFLKHAMARGERAGIAPEQMVVDPGFGFGKSVEGNLELLRRLDELHALGRPLLVGTSRKSFIGKILDRDVNERIFGTAATMTVARMRGAGIFRVHDVKEMRDVLDMTDALQPVPEGRRHSHH